MNLPSLETQAEILKKIEEKDWSTPTFKVKHFVGNSHIHPLHKIEQYLLELKSRRELQDAHNYDLEKFEALMELEEEKKEFCQFNAERKLCDIEIKDLQRKANATREKIRVTQTEINTYLSLIEEFNNSEEGYAPDGTRYFDILSDSIKREQIEEGYWEYRLAKQAAMDMIAYGRIGSGNMEAIMQLDADAQNKTIAMAYEVLIMNENRMNNIQGKVVERLESGAPVSDIYKLMNMTSSDFTLALEKQEKQNVPLIQKR